MQETKWGEIRSVAREFRASIERDLVLRRYHKWMQGEVPMEDKVLDFAAKVKARILVSWRAVIKRGLDLMISVAGFILSSPLMLVVALAVKWTSKGPVIFKQVRVGQNGKLFSMYKFRTMRQDAESQSGPVWARVNDPRVTPIGLFLRKTHLDELPQFFNVIKGEMSIVGPRPERPYFVGEFAKSIPNYEKRLFAKPGVTGLAQTKRSYDETLADVKKKLKYDLLYIEKMCPILDVKVIGMTIGSVIFGTGR